MPNEQPQRELPADVFDALELGALAAGGIGKDSFYADELSLCPVCIHGLASFCDNGDGKVSDVLFDAGIGYIQNDYAVYAINQRLGRPVGTRVTFRRWCRELNVVRGPHPEPDPAIWGAPTRQPKRNKRCDDGAPTSPEASI